MAFHIKVMILCRIQCLLELKPPELAALDDLHA
jgi:hypothetical protein